MTSALTAEQLLEAFADVAVAVGDAVRPLSAKQRRERTATAGQYALDLHADRAALGVLSKLPVRVLSEESGWSGPEEAEVVVVLDPVDGSTNCARDIPYFATSISALVDGQWFASSVCNLATGVTTTATSDGAWRDGVPIVCSHVETVNGAVVALSGLPTAHLPWKQYRALGSCALALCDVAAGLLDAYVDTGRWHRPWDYLGGLHACQQAGAVFLETHGEPLIVAEQDATRGMLVAATTSLLDDLRPAIPESRP